MPSSDQQPSVKKRSAISRTMSRSTEALRDARSLERIVPAAFLAGILIALLYYVLLSPPRGFTTPAVIQIKSQTLSQTALQLQEAQAIRSPLLFKLIVRVLGADTRVHAGSYFFASPQNLLTIISRLEAGDFELDPVRIYIPEGSTVQDIGDILAKKLAPFDETTFLAVAEGREGYLYPDTYFFFPDQDPAVVERAMEVNFNKHFDPIAAEASAFGKPLRDIVTMASIVVGEARTPSDRRIVAGILWKRIKLGIPLQVDAPFGYIYEKNLTQLTSADLKIDSPYNTYLYKGLPPTPINNPAIGALTAVIEPTETPYLFYLSDNNGTMHFSKTYAQHLQQIKQYLR